MLIHLNEGAIELRDATACRSIHVIETVIGGEATNILVTTEPMPELTIPELATKKVLDAKLALRGVRDAVNEPVQVGGCTAALIGFATFDEAAGLLATSQLLIGVGTRVVALANTSPVARAPAIRTAMKSIAATFKLRKA